MIRVRERTKSVLIRATMVLIAFTLLVYVMSTLFGLPVHVAMPRNTEFELTQQEGTKMDSVKTKREFVKQMMKDAWDDYKRHAWGKNELNPLSETGSTGGDRFGYTNFGATIVDSLDTLYIMGLIEEYKEGRDWVAKYLNFQKNVHVSVFEFNIRFMGGLLSAFALTGDAIYKEKAIDLGKRLLPAFNSPSGLPYGYINLITGEPRSPNDDVVLAEFGSLHLEFTYLSAITGDPIYAEKVDKIRHVMRTAAVKSSGFYWNYANPSTGEFSKDHVSIGAMGDSFYEYLIKSYIQTGDMEARQMYDNAMNAIVSNGMIQVSKPSKLLYIAEWDSGIIQNLASHLACFAGGMFALGSHVDARPPGTPERERDMDIGKNFTSTCHESYVRTVTRIGPEGFEFSDSLEVNGGDSRYLLRPEVVESYFVLYRVTGDPKYRDWGWDAALAIEKYCKAGPGRGYSGLDDVNFENPRQDNVQQSFFLAETLKYLYLLFSPKNVMSLDEWVFNTECHPLPVKLTNPLYQRQSEAIVDIPNSSQLIVNQV